MVASIQHSLAFIRAFVNNLRLELLFVSASCALAGMAYGTQTNRLLFLLAFLAFFLCYGFGKALTDELSKFKQDKHVIKTNSTGLVICACVITILNPWNILFAVLSIAALWGYVTLKRKSLLTGPLYLGIVIALLPVMGLLSMGGGIGDAIKPQMLWLYTFTLFSFGNLLLMSQLKVIQTDKSFGFKTIPAVLGWTKAVIVGDIFVILSIAAAGMMINYSDTFALILFIVGSLIGIGGQVVAHITSKRGENVSQFIITSTLRSFVLWHIAVFIGERSDWLIFACGFYLLFEASLKLKVSFDEN